MDKLTDSEVQALLSLYVTEEIQRNFNQPLAGYYITSAFLLA